ncbi:hypothetical protein GQ602_007239 [Ophiocordyceps camponoti-floridani]|uniref:Uncharacterized protein n=1 Tax=Ophiocordyceps camponoti-floridani TaxID=2030778 RepID=A0A8H4VAN5_9HYPO|nr:hypothetical protein GQ602_007239 [Ophiocordyceps camponoti-floridani]
MRSILGKSNRVRKASRKDRRQPEQHETPFQDRLADLGVARLLADELTLRDVVQAMRYIRTSMFSPMPEKGLYSTRVAEVLNYRAAMPAVVTLSHLHAVLPSPTRTERELAELIDKGVIRKLRVERRGGMGEAVVEAAELEAMIRRSDASSEAAEALVVYLRRNPTSQTLSEGVLSSDHADELLRAGFLTSWTRTTPGGDSRLDARPEDRTTLTSVERVSRFASGSVSAVGGQQAVHLAGGGADTGSGGSRPERGVRRPASFTAGTGAVPEAGLGGGGLGSRDAGEDALGEGPESWLRDRFEAGGLTGMRWKEFRGLGWEWTIGLAVGLGVVEMFETGAVGRGVRALG